jgi:hypothetical protein
MERGWLAVAGMAVARRNRRSSRLRAAKRWPQPFCIFTAGRIIKTRTGGCDDDYTLTILLRPSTTSASVSSNLRDWATKAVAQYKDYNTIKNFETWMLPR